MWIRSQDKEKLVKLEKEIGIFAIDRKMIRVDDISAYADDENGRYSVGGLGTYWTKQKAMKVLDMIEKFLNPNFKKIDAEKHKIAGNDDELDAYVYALRNTFICEPKEIVFQMPQDNEVD